MSNFSESKPKLPSHLAYSVEQGKDDKNHWQKIGAMWETRDGYSLRVSAIPLDGNIALRSREAVEQMRAQREQEAAEAPAPQPRMKP